MKRFITILCTAALIAASGCTREPEVKITAGFTTDKDIYSILDPVLITNTSVAENAQIAICRWELGGERVSYDFVPENLTYEQAGTYTIKLTVTSDVGAKQSSFEKTITVVDDNISPKADFSYAPVTVVAGEEVLFTDLSTDEDGEITDWEWTFGTTRKTEQHPQFTFVETGEVSVSLKVTDDKLGTDTKTVTVDVKPGKISLNVLWEYPYETKENAYAFFTSPAVSSDGNHIYVTSTGYSLVAVSKDGQEEWRCNIGQFGATAANNDGSIRTPSPTPSVDSDGTVYIAAGYNEKKEAGKPSSIMAVKDGSVIWHHERGPASYRFFTPTIFGDYVAFITRNDKANDSDKDKNFQIRNKATGELVYSGHVNGGSYGTLMPLANGMIVAGTGGNHGCRLFFPDGEGKWKFSSVKNNGREHNLGGVNADATCDSPNGNVCAADKNGRIYILFRNEIKKDISADYGAVLYCYDTGKLTFGEAPVPEWKIGIRGTAGQTGCGVVLGEDGTCYVTTSDSGETPGRIAAVTSDGTLKWEKEADGDINSSPAVDNEGFIYYCDKTTGKLVKLAPEDGERVVEIKLGDEIRTSPTIAPDGTIYINVMKEDKPVLVAVKGSASGGAESWSQLGGNCSKTGYKY